ncbi:MAG: hypothetical protein JRE18_10220, partial [Deltaproteobacteria bacterium]|nr:hypothetical protein [Deltaproteobacteria bacterium]
MARKPRLALAVAGTVLAAACTSSSAQSVTTTAPPTTTTTTTQPTTTTTRPATTTTERPIVPVDVVGDVAPDIAATLGAALTAINDHRAEGPVPAGMLEATSEVQGTLTEVTVLEVATADLATGGIVGVVTTETRDVIAIADDGAGWEVVGGHLASAGADPWYGESPRRVLVLGSDARPGQSPPVHRMDSIHILTAAPAQTAGSILGYPRDSWVGTDYGSMRLNALTTSGRGPDALFPFF